jgi:hypothetical protein
MSKFITAMRKNEFGSCDKHEKLEEDLTKALGMTEGVPVIKIADIVRKYGYYFKVENGEQCMNQLEELMKNSKKTLDKLQSLQAKQKAEEEHQASLNESDRHNSHRGKGTNRVTNN